MKIDWATVGIAIAVFVLLTMFNVGQYLPDATTWFQKAA